MMQRMENISHFNPIIVLFLTFLTENHIYLNLEFQSYYSLIFNLDFSQQSNHQSA